MNKPLVSIVIPTRNSEETLPLCLESIRRQTYRNIEVIVVDSYSIDRTVEIAKRYGTKVIETRGALLWARYLGHLHVKGEIELLLDSDQILDPTAIERSVKLVERGCDAVILEEFSYKPKTLIQWLFFADRIHVHRIIDLHPVHGVLLARMFRKEILDKTFLDIRWKMPLTEMFSLVSQDHAVIYYEAWKYVKKICIVKRAVYHIEVDSPTKLIKKFYKYGKTEYSLSKYYPELAKGKHSPRKITLHPSSLASLTLWLLKALPYMLGRLSSQGGEVLYRH